MTHGQFAFTTTESGNYLACFWVDGNHQGGGLSVSLDWRIGIAAKDWESVAKKEKIEVTIFFVAILIIRGGKMLGLGWLGNKLADTKTLLCI